MGIEQKKKFAQSNQTVGPLRKFRETNDIYKKQTCLFLEQTFGKQEKHRSLHTTWPLSKYLKIYPQNKDGL